MELRDKISERQIEMMKHTVGLDQKQKQKEYYRNRYIIGKNSDEVALLDDLEFKGYMNSDMYQENTRIGTQYIYWLNEKGFEFIQQFNDYKPKKGFVIEGD